MISEREEKQGRQIIALKRLAVELTRQLMDLRAEEANADERSLNAEVAERDEAAKAKVEAEQIKAKAVDDSLKARIEASAPGVFAMPEAPAVHATTTGGLTFEQPAA